MFNWFKRKNIKQITICDRPTLEAQEFCEMVASKYGRYSYYTSYFRVCPDRGIELEHKLYITGMESVTCNTIQELIRILPSVKCLIDAKAMYDTQRRVNNG